MYAYTCDKLTAGFDIEVILSVIAIFFYRLMTGLIRG